MSKQGFTHVWAVFCPTERSAVQLLRRTQDISGQLARVRKQGADLARANLTDKVADNRKQQERLSVRVQVSK